MSNSNQPGTAKPAATQEEPAAIELELLGTRLPSSNALVVNEFRGALTEVAEALEDRRISLDPKLNLERRVQREIDAEKEEARLAALSRGVTDEVLKLDEEYKKLKKEADEEAKANPPSGLQKAKQIAASWALWPGATTDDYIEGAKKAADAFEETTGFNPNPIAVVDKLIMDNFVKYVEPPDAEANYATIRLGNARVRLERLFEKLNTVKPFLAGPITEDGRERRIDASMQLYTTMANLLHAVDRKRFAELEPEISAVLKIASEMSKDDFEERGYRVPVDFDKFPDGVLAEELGLIDRASVFPDEDLLSGTTAVPLQRRVAQLEAHYQSMKILRIAQQNLESGFIQLAQQDLSDDELREAAPHIFQQKWTTFTRGLSQEASRMMVWDIMNGYSRGLDDMPTLSDHQLSCMALIVEKNRRENPTDLVANRMSEAHKIAVHETYISSKIEVQYGSIVSELSDEDLSRAIAEYQSESAEDYQKAEVFYGKLSAEAGHYVALIQSIGEIPTPGDPRLKFDPTRIATEVDVVRDGKTVREWQLSPELKQIISHLSLAYDKISQTTREDMGGSKDEVEKLLKEYVKANNGNAQIREDSIRVQTNYGHVMPK